MFPGLRGPIPSLLQVEQIPPFSSPLLSRVGGLFAVPGILTRIRKGQGLISCSKPIHINGTEHLSLEAIKVCFSPWRFLDAPFHLMGSPEQQHALGWQTLAISSQLVVAGEVSGPVGCILASF